MDNISGIDHDNRWFEVDASYLGAQHFDRKYGRGRDDYYYNSPNHFDINSFRTGSNDIYKNPRAPKKNKTFYTSGAICLPWYLCVL